MATRTDGKDSTELAALSRAHKALIAARTVPEVANIRDQAEAVRYACKCAGKSLHVVNEAAEVKLRAERKAGELLAGMEKNPGNRAGGSTMEPPATLEEVGVTKKQSHRWQRVASIPEDDFDLHIDQTKAACEELSTASVLRLAAVVNAPKPEPKGFASVMDAMKRLKELVAAQCARWPADSMSFMVERLRSLADEIEQHGGL